jgi:hypothetical protein
VADRWKLTDGESKEEKKERYHKNETCKIERKQRNERNEIKAIEGRVPH